MNHSWAKPGVKCVCVEALFYYSGPLDDRVPFVGEVVTIDGTEWHGGEKYLRLVGYPYESKYLTTCFRPLVTRTEEQDVKLFKHLLSDQPVEERV